MPARHGIEEVVVHLTVRRIGSSFRSRSSPTAACALEYNVVRWGKTELPPEAGVAVYVRGPSGKPAAARIYDDAEPPPGAPA